MIKKNLQPNHFYYSPAFLCTVLLSNTDIIVEYLSFKSFDLHSELRILSHFQGIFLLEFLSPFTHEISQSLKYAHWTTHKTSLLRQVLDFQLCQCS